MRPVSCGSMHDEVPSNQPEIDRFRVALKFSLWTWALYWPGGGILLLTGGLDPISIFVVLASFGSFIALMMSGALQTTSSRNMKQLIMERPIYFIAAVALLALLTPFIAPAASVGLVLFATVYLGGMVFVLVRLAQVYKTQDKPFMQSGMDQSFIAIGLGAFAAFLVFADAWLTMLGGEAISGPAFTVAVANWINLLYPPLVMLGTKGLREPLRKPTLRGDPEPAVVPELVHA